jgi:hypothetical protein
MIARQSLCFQSGPKTFPSALGNPHSPSPSRRIGLLTVSCLRNAHDFSSRFHSFSTEAKNVFPHDLKAKKLPNPFFSGVDSA